MSHPSTAPTGYDLRTFLRAVSSGPMERSLSMEPSERPVCDTPVELLENDVVRVQAPPMQVAGWIDGVQNAITVTHREHRGIYLAWAAAGAVAAGGHLIGMRQQLSVICSVLDADWLAENTDPAGRPPFEVLEVTSPPEVETHAVKLLATVRDGLEASLVDALTEQDRLPLVVDGSLTNRVVNEQLHGVVKTTRRRYLPDETVLYKLPAGFRSPIFRIPAGTYGVSADRFSCYLRLHDARHSPWDFALIRLESYTPEALEPLAARALCERQGAGSGDRRYDRHLRAVAETEDVLRAFRPAVYEL